MDSRLYARRQSLARWRAEQVDVGDFEKQRKIDSQATADTGYVQCLAISPDSKHVAAIPSSAGQDLQVFRLPP